MKKRILPFLLSGIIGFSSIFSGIALFGGAQIYASTSNVVTTVGIEESSFWSTALIKTAIKGIIKSKSFAVNTVRNLMGVTAANALDKNFSMVVNELNKLLSYSSLVTQSVHDAVYRGLINANVSRSIATNVLMQLKYV